MACRYRLALKVHPMISLRAIVLFLLILSPSSAKMSQVFEDKIEIPYEELIQQSTDVVFVKNLNIGAEYSRVVFSKATHFEEKEETVYVEEIRQFEILKIYKSDKMKVGDTFWLRRESDYDLGAIELYHKQGILESPIVTVYQAKFTDNTNGSILFLNKIVHDVYDDLYQSYNDAVEGEGAGTQLQELLTKIYE